MVQECGYVSGVASHYPDFAIVAASESAHAGKEQVVLVAEKPLNGVMVVEW